MCDISTDIFPHPFVAKSSLERLRKWFFGRGDRKDMQLGSWRNAALYFASRTPNRVVFRVALGRENTGVLHVTVWPRSTPVEAVGFELIVRCSEKWVC